MRLPRLEEGGHSVKPKRPNWNEVSDHCDWSENTRFHLLDRRRTSGGISVILGIRFQGHRIKIGISVKLLLGWKDLLALRSRSHIVFLA